jgi:hypothetical protein
MCTIRDRPGQENRHAEIRSLMATKRYCTMALKKGIAHH